MSDATCQKKKFSFAPNFLALRVQYSRFGERFRDGQYSMISLLCGVFFYSRCPPCTAICKSWGHVPPCPMESAPLMGSVFTRINHRHYDCRVFTAGCWCFCHDGLRL